LHVQPGAKRSEFAGRHGERIKPRLAAPPIEGKANAALIEFLAECVKSRAKRVAIEGAPEWKMPRS
jgi:uncharacterized protein